MMNDAYCMEDGDMYVLINIHVTTLTPETYLRIRSTLEFVHSIRVTMT